MKRNIIKTVMIVFGAFIAALGLNIFLEPNSITPGGISGLAMLVNRISNGLLPIGAMTFVLNIPLFIMGYRELGKEFIIKSVIGTVMYSIMIDVVSYIPKSVYKIFYTGGEGHLMLYAIWGGLFIGLGYGMIFRGGATTGGTDIGARLLQRKMSWMTLGQLVLGFDVLFLIIVAVTYQSVVAAMYTGIAVFVSSKIIDVVEAGVNYAKEIYIVTDKPKEVADEILEHMQRGVTKLNGEGMYTGKAVSILWCIVYNRQLPQIRKIVDKHDPNAFIIVNEVRETKGLHD